MDRRDNVVSECDLDEAGITSEALGGLTEEQTERLTCVLDRFLSRLEAGDPVDRQRLLEQNADIREPLSLYLEKLSELHNFAAGFSPQLAGLDDLDVLSLDPDAAAGGDTGRNRTPGASAPFLAVAAPTSPSASSSTAAEPVPALDRPAEVLANSAANSAAEFAGDMSGQLVDRLRDELPENDSADTSSEPSARRFGDFDLLRVIGRGGMGIVYEAQQLSLRRRVALKLLPPASVLDARQITRFKNEAQAAASLQHPHIVPVYAVGNHRGTHYYAMRLIDGHPLDAIIAALRKTRDRPRPAETAGDAPPMPDSAEESESTAIDTSSADFGWGVPTDMQRVLRLGLEAASALAAAHEDGIIHRDIKPSNLLVDRQGKLWVTDFGLARRVNDHSLTASGDVLGTLRYMSPEQATGQTALVDTRSDIYSLGVTLYELLALEPAIAGEGSPALLRAIEQQAPISLRHHRRDLPRDLVTVIETAIAKDRNDRYPTVQQFADDLARVLEGRPVLAKPPSLFVRLAKWAMRHHRLVMAAALFSVMAAFGLALSTWIARQNASQAEQALEDLRQTTQELYATLDETRAEVSEDLKQSPGTEHARRKLLSRLIERYRKILNSSRKRASAPADVAVTLERLGVLQREVGDLDESQEHLREALKMNAALLDQRPGDFELKKQWASCSYELGRVTALKGDMRLAESAERDAVKVAATLAADHPDSEEFLAQVARYRNDLALLLADTGRKQEARGLLEQTRAELSSFHEQSPTSAEIQSLLAATYNNLCSVISKEDPGAAVTLYERSLQLQQELLSTSEYQSPPSALLAVTYSNYGGVLSRAGQLQEASEALQRAIAIQRQLLAIAPAHTLFSRDLSVSLNNFAAAESKLNRPENAQAAYREAIALLEELIDKQPSDASLAHDLGGTYNNLANLLQLWSDVPAIDAAFDQAIAHQRRALKAAPSVASYRDYLDNHLENYSIWLRKSHRDQRAFELAVERQQLWKQNPERLIEVAEDLAKVALAMAADGKKQGVSERYATAAFDTLGLVDQRGDRVQSLLAQEPFSSLAKLKTR